MSPKPRRILYYENGVGYGGAVISLIHLLKALNRDDFEPHVLTTAASSDYSRLATVSVWATMTGRCFDPGRLRGALPAFALSGKLISAADYLLNVFPQAARIVSYARRHRIDLIHVNNEPVGNLPGVMAARLLRIPCVSHVRGTLWDSSLTRRVLRGVDHFLAISRFIEEEVVRFGVAPARLTVVSEGFDFAPFLEPLDPENSVRGEYGIPADAPLVGIAGVLMEWKGQETVIRSLRRVLERFPECRLLVIGKAPGGHEWYRERLERAAHEAGVSHRVIFTGFRADTERVFRQLDVLVHASQLAEPFGRVIVEGMAAGVVVVASTLGAPPEIIEDCVTGRLVPPGEPESLARVLVELLEQGELRGRMGAAAKTQALATYGAARHAQLVEGVYRQLLEKEAS